jgi:hypothetical protein
MIDTMTNSTLKAPNTGKVWVPGDQSTGKNGVTSSGLTIRIIPGIITLIVLAIFIFGAITTLLTSREADNFNEKVEGNTLSYTLPKVYWGAGLGIYPNKTAPRYELEQSWVEDKVSKNHRILAGGVHSKTNLILFDGKNDYYKILENKKGNEITLTISKVDQKDLNKSINEVDDIQFGDKSS